MGRRSRRWQQNTLRVRLERGAGETWASSGKVRWSKNSMTWPLTRRESRYVSCTPPLERSVLTNALQAVRLVRDLRDMGVVVIYCRYKVGIIHGPIRTEFGFHLIKVKHRSGLDAAAVLSR